ncbi:Uncharacterized protein YhaN [Devosia enhydra]|uniref:Uncharacterized protein YhaN n=1 Tax=Devosia enhydra TaxID=665118 RepID=A0A1K2HZH1_9HYPH|nr:AAA family ATPase [Devosia enhydra]SFZ85541.1 Uncharacterized protein YhaN [Devosia enhydra]
MRLRRLDLNRYGKFTDHSIDFGAARPGTPDLHIVYGLNEAGKSTALSAYLDLLFGIEERTRYGFLHQPKTMEVGGALEFSGRTHALRRIKQRANSLLDAQGQPVNEALLSVPLAGLSREAYRMMFSLDDQTLEEGGNAILESKGDLGELLFSASAGLAGISGILEGVAKEADGIFRKRASSTRMAELKREMAELKTRRDAIDVQASTFRQLTGALQQADTAYEGAARGLAEAQARQRQITRLLRALPLRGELSRLGAEAKPLAGLPHPPPDWPAALTGLETERAALIARDAAEADHEARLEARRDGLWRDEAVLTFADAISGLADGEARFVTADKDLPKLRPRLAQWQERLGLLLADLGEAGHAEPQALVVPAATLGALRGLIAERSGVEVRLEKAEAEHRAASEAVAALERGDDDAAGREPVGPALIATITALLGRLRSGDLVGDQRQARRMIEERKRALADAVRALSPWPADAETLARIAPLPAERLSRWQDRLDMLVRDKKQLAGEIASVRALMAETEARRTVLRQGARLISDEEAQDARARRDAAWTEHMAQLDRPSAEAFAERLRHTDAIAEARLLGAAELAELRVLSSDLAAAQARETGFAAALEANRAAEAALADEIAAAVPAGVLIEGLADPASRLGELARWSLAHGAAREALIALRRAESEREAADAGLAEVQEGLAAALSSRDPAMARLPLDALLAAADALLSEATAARARTRLAEKHRAEVMAAATVRARAFAAAKAGRADWQARWQAAIGSSWFADRADDPTAVEALLGSLAGLSPLLAEGQELAHRVEAMTADQERFVRAVAEIADGLGEGVEPDAALVAARGLRARLDAARTVEAQAERLATDLEALGDRRAAIAAQLRGLESRLEAMKRFFGFETPEAVRSALDLCQRRDQIAAASAELSRRIAAEMEAPALDEALAKMEGADGEALEAELAELSPRVEGLEAQVRARVAERAIAEDRLAAIGGDDAVARIEGRRRTLVLEMEDLALRYLRLRSGALLAEQALRAYRERHRSAMMNRASEAFRQMTRGAYAGLATRPEKEREALIGLVEGGGSKLAVDMSKGTRFQLYLALRLAGYEEFATARPPVPFIADDIMETFDEPRSEEVFRLLGRMAGMGQVIYLTHHRHLCAIARAVVPGVTIHEIDAGA